MNALQRIRTLARDQLVQGTKPERLALGFALSVAIGTFPLLGFSTVGCLAIGGILRLNQPFLQAVNYILAPAQLLLMPAFLRAGEWLFGKPPIPFSPIVMLHDFFEAPSHFLAVYGGAGLLAVAAWAIFAVVICPFLFLISRGAFAAAQVRISGNSEAKK